MRPAAGRRCVLSCLEGTHPPRRDPSRPARTPIGYAYIGCRSTLDRMLPEPTPPAPAQRTAMSATRTVGNGTEAFRQSVETVLSALEVDPRYGLSRQEAAVRLHRYGKNALQAEKRIPAWRKLLRQFQDLLVILLLIAATISTMLWLYERESTPPLRGAGHPCRGDPQRADGLHAAVAGRARRGYAPPDVSGTRA